MTATNARAEAAAHSSELGQVSWRTRRYWRVRASRQARYRFAPYDGTSLVRFFVQRPSGGMSSYRLGGALRDARVGLQLRGARDPIFVSINGMRPIRLPALRGPVHPRKVPLLYGSPAEQLQPKAPRRRRRG